MAVQGKLRVKLPKGVEWLGESARGRGSGTFTRDARLILFRLPVAQGQLGDAHLGQGRP